MRGALVVLEGAEGVGKTTQLRRLSARAARQGLAVTLVREPGGTPVGDEVRRLLLETSHAIVPRAEALLFMASRAQLIDDLIRPALSRGDLVLTDRFFLSTYAYQIAGRGLDEAGVIAANGFATTGVVPDVTLLLDLPATVGAERVAARGAQDRVERAGDAFHERVRAAFRQYASPEWQKIHPECGPISLVDAAGSELEVEERIWGHLAAQLPETFLSGQGSHKYG